MIDSFLYFNEQDLFFLRLEYLDPWVDKFVIVETDTTFSLQPHAAHFDSVYSKLPEHLKKKIVYQFLKIDPAEVAYSGDPNSEEYKPKSRYVEQAMRETLSALVKTVDQSGWVMMSDLDEIWDPRQLDQAKHLVDQHGKMFWAQDFRTAYIDWQMIYGRWPGTKTTRVDLMPDPISDLYCSKNKTWGHYGPAVLEAGWHLTMMGEHATKSQQISAKREGPGWEQKLQKSSDEISAAMVSNGYNTVVKKKKMRAHKVGVAELDPQLVTIARKYPTLWSNDLTP